MLQRGTLTACRTCREHHSVNSLAGWALIFMDLDIEYSYVKHNTYRCSLEKCLRRVRIEVDRTGIKNGPTGIVLVFIWY